MLAMRAFLAPFLTMAVVVPVALMLTNYSLAQMPPAPAAETGVPDLVIETKDGLVTATFSDRTDDAALLAALPSLATKHVESLILRGAPIRDGRGFARLTDLKALDLTGTQLRDIAPLAGLTNLRSLNLQFVRIFDLRPLSEMTELKALNLCGTEVRDLSPLANLTDLRDLVVSVTKIKDLTPLTPLRRLTSLDLGGTWIRNLKPLAGMANLRFLSLNGTPVEDLQPLAHLASLVTLDLGGTLVSDVQALSELSFLETLDLEGTQVTDVKPLARLPALRSVGLGGSLVHDTTSLVRLTSTAPAVPARAAVDPVLFWNDQTNRSIQATAADPFRASRALAIESIAVLDTFKSVDGGAAFMVRLAAPKNIPAGVAASAAAHALLVHLFPTRVAALDAAFVYALADERPDPSRALAIAFGEAMAAAAIARREEDGVDSHPDARVGSVPGNWRPTPPEFLPPMHPQWAHIEPFALKASNQFRPGGPPPPDSDAFRRARGMVASIGALRSTERTAEQTQIAHYWSDAIGTYAPAGHWNAIAASIVAPLHLGISVEAELFAELNVALADAGIAMADAKYTFWEWRPITAIRAGDHGDLALADWIPLLETPNHPSYISGHSAFSAAAAAVMTAWFGQRPFTFVSANLQGVTRKFTSFDQAAEEAALSRLYGGIHYPFDNVDGLVTGRSVGVWTMGVFQRLGDDRGPSLMIDGAMDGQMGTSKRPRVLAGCALSNLAPISAITVQLDGELPFNVQVDERGLFAVPADRLQPFGHHEVTIAATSATGRVSTLRIDVE